MRQAPPWSTTRWFNTETPLTLEALRGEVVLLHAFQMLCPGCVQRALPQLQRVHELFAGAPLRAVGLHTVFEDHQAQAPEALEQFLREAGYTFPVGIDAHEPHEPLGIPRTMRAYGMQGTPTLVLIDAAGRLRRQVLGPHEDLPLGAELGTLLAELTRAG